MFAPNLALGAIDRTSVRVFSAKTIREVEHAEVDGGRLALPSHWNKLRRDVRLYGDWGNAVAIYRYTKDALVALTETQLSAENILERKDLQRLLRAQIQTLDPDLIVISEEFGQWVDSSRRIDLLCIDKEANLVVVELKRSEDGGYMELQAIRYAAMISTLTFQQLVDVHKQYLAKNGQSSDEAEQNILSFLKWEQPDDDRFANEVHIVLAAADFSKELTTSVLWLNEQGIDHPVYTAKALS
jgi:hypothetical protein